MENENKVQFQKDLFGKEVLKKEVNKIDEHWVGMPEYENEPRIKPFIVVTFKFRNQKDYDKFNTLVKRHLYNNETCFTGNQRRQKKSTWYPHFEKPDDWRYVEDES